MLQPYSLWEGPYVIHFYETREEAEMERDRLQRREAKIEASIREMANARYIE